MAPADRDLKVEYRPLGVLISYARNPRTHSEEQIAEVVSGKPRTLW